MTALNALFSLLFLLLLGVFLYGPWQGTCTAYARQIMFEKRDAIFDLARDGKLSFHSREYRTVRAMLEKTIRFAHEATLPATAVIAAVLLWRREEVAKPELLAAIERIPDPATRKQVQELVNQALNALLISLILKSPVALVVLVVVLVPLLLLVLALSLLSVTAGLSRKCARALWRRLRLLLQIEAERVESTPDAVTA